MMATPLRSQNILNQYIYISPDPLIFFIDFAKPATSLDSMSVSIVDESPIEIPGEAARPTAGGALFH